MTAVLATGPVVDVIRLRPAWWTGPAAPGRNLLRALTALARSVWTLATAVLLAQVGGVAVTPAVIALSGAVVIPLIAVLAWQWDTTTAVDVAERAERVAWWTAVTGRRPGLTGAVLDAAAALERWARAELAAAAATGGAR